MLFRKTFSTHIVIPIQFYSLQFVTDTNKLFYFSYSEFYEKVTSHRANGVKVLIAIGGWNDSLGSKYSKLVNNPAARRKFTEHVIQFIQKHNFDGLDLDWEYPKCWQVRNILICGQTIIKKNTIRKQNCYLIHNRGLKQ